MSALSQLTRHVQELHQCQACPLMHRPVVSGPPVLSSIILIGQAPGVKEPLLGRPFAWTAGKTMFHWFQEYCGIDEASFRAKIYMAAVCRCYPGKNPTGGDRVPNDSEIKRCSQWMEAEFHLLRPKLVLAVGKLAISQFMPCGKLDAVVGQLIRVERFGQCFDLIALPHPSGASTWHRMEPGKMLLKRGLKLVKEHQAFHDAFS
ncbi:MAG: uracil-DNA glycosylase family protein [Blastochloris sp.]|nr:uracil-DNA glycosylase family protein [Blastochloris sp.]